MSGVFSGPQNDRQREVVSAFMHAWNAYKVRVTPTRERGANGVVSRVWTLRLSLAVQCICYSCRKFDQKRFQIPKLLTTSLR